MGKVQQSASVTSSSVDSAPAVAPANFSQKYGNAAQQDMVCSATDQVPEQAGGVVTLPEMTIEGEAGYTKQSPDLDSDDTVIQSWVDRAYAQAAGLKEPDRTKRAFDWLCGQRHRSAVASVDVNMAAAEHYLDARRNAVTDGVLGGVLSMGFYGLVYDPGKAIAGGAGLMPGATDLPPSPPTGASMRWGAAGAKDGMMDAPVPDSASQNDGDQQKTP